MLHVDNLAVVEFQQERRDVVIGDDAVAIANRLGPRQFLKYRRRSVFVEDFVADVTACACALIEKTARWDIEA